MSEPVLDVQDVYKIHRGGRDASEEQPVLRGVNLRVAAGEFRCVMGPSGSGKTTLLHLLSGLDQPSAGKILLGGVDLARATEADRTRQRRDQVGYVFQFFPLMPNLTVEENIALPVAVYITAKGEACTQGRVCTGARPAHIGSGRIEIGYETTTLGATITVVVDAIVADFFGMRVN